MNLSLTLQTIARVHPDQPAIAWDGGQLSYAAFEAQVQRIAGALIARHGLQARRPRRAGDGELPGIFPAALRHLARRAFRRAAQQQAASQGDGVDPGRLRSRSCASPAPSSPAALSSPGLGDLAADRCHRQRRSPRAARAAIPIADGPATATPRPGCSTPAAPPAGPRAPCSATATCCSPATATMPTSTIIDTRDTILHAAPLTHGSGLYGLAHIARGGNNVILEGSFEPEQVFDALATTAQRQHVRRADHGVAPDQSPPRRLRRHARAQDHHLRRRAHVPRRSRARARAAGPQALQSLRPGREPHDHHRPRQGHACRQRPSPMGGAARQRRRGAHGRRGEDRRRGRPRTAARRDRRDRHPQRLRDAGLLEQSGRQRQGHARRLAVDGRPRRHGRRRLRHPQGPLQGS